LLLLAERELEWKAGSDARLTMPAQRQYEEIFDRDARDVHISSRGSANRTEDEEQRTRRDERRISNLTDKERSPLVVAATATVQKGLEEHRIARIIGAVVHKHEETTKHEHQTLVLLRHLYLKYRDEYTAGAKELLGNDTKPELHRLPAQGSTRVGDGGVLAP
jgi:hypothetical protein